VAFREVSDSLIAHTKVREQLGCLDSQVVTLRKYLELVRLRYENGYTNYTQVRRAQLVQRRGGADTDHEQCGRFTG
jgi:outer membrane protein TolC